MMFSLLALPQLIAFCLGLSWVLASLGVYLRDIQQIIGVATSALMFLSPIFYSIESVPSALANIIWLNPLTGFVEITRNSLVFHQAPSANVYLLITLSSIAMLAIGAWWFSATKKGFADVI
jgi:lipopolysaccharide transport system permease protein